MQVSAVGLSQIAYPQQSQRVQPQQQAATEEASESAAEKAAEASKVQSGTGKSSSLSGLDIFA
jgi:hypothetical protein